MRIIVLGLVVTSSLLGLVAFGTLSTGCAGTGTLRDAGLDRDAGDAADVVDAADAAEGSVAACDVTKPFSPPDLVANVNGTTDELRARLSADELTMYLEINGKNVPGSHLWRTKRPTKQSPFGTLEILPTVNAQPSGGPTVTADGLTLFFSTGSSPQIWQATRATTSAEFGAPAAVANVNVVGNQGTPYVRPDGSALYFSGGTPKLHLHRSTSSGGVFGAPEALTTLTSAGDEFDPVTNQSDLVIYFASNRVDPSAKGGLDIWMSRRTSTSVPFPAPTNVSELNTGGWDAPTWLSDDECTLYLIADRNGSKDVFVTTRPK